MTTNQTHVSPVEGAGLCEDCPPVGYPTDKTRCWVCPRRAAPEEGGQPAPVSEPAASDGQRAVEEYERARRLTTTGQGDV